ncbi:DNA internalization-related competence protein ComEC/Rec2 [Ottowia sp.]|uniref:DNA internalization-related competence protein ComEC/Rec2 n=1 Tax=Ottowia sp. TaxID=1898956 RepID=UPI003926E1DA
MAAALMALPLGVWLGTAVQLQQRALDGAAVYGLALAGAGLLALVAAWGSRRAAPGHALAVAWLLVGALAAWGAAGTRAVGMAAQALAPALEGRDVVLTGVVARMPQHDERGWRLVLDVQAARLDGAAVAVPPRVQLAWYDAPMRPGAAAPLGPSEPIRAGDRWQLTARLKAPHGSLNPHGFDVELWLWEQGVGATGYVRTGPRDAPPQRLAQGQGHLVERARQHVRDGILALGQGGDEAARHRLGIIAALVTGDQNVIERSDWDVFRATGVAHLMSISGLHITMFAWITAGAVGWLWRRSARWRGWGRFSPCLLLPAPSAAWVGGVLLAAAYALFSGWGVPAQRTVLMLACMTALRISGLRWPWWLTWLWAGAVVLLIDPWAMLQAGFWLSFVAVGVLFATDSRAAGAEQKGATAHLKQLLREQGVVTLALTPLSLMLFGQASVVGLLANLIAIPWVTLVVTPLALAGVLWAPLWSAAAAALQPLSALLAWLAAWPWAQLSLPAAPLALGALAVAGGALAAMRWPWPLRLAGLPLVLPFVLWQPARPAPGTFELLAADVGQGSAVLVRTASHTLLYDAGPRYSADSDAGQRVLVPLLRALGERVDRLVLSHRDTDHTGGAAAVLAQYPRAALTTSIEAGRTLEGLPAGEPCLAGSGWQWDGVRFDVLYPDAEQAAAARRSNAMSCVIRVGTAQASVLLTGDIEAPQEQALVAGGAPLHSDVLLVPHHGSRTSSSAAWLDAVQPRLALVQAGYRNAFGHPAAPVLARYAERGVRVIASPACGAMHWRSAAPEALQCERDIAARYWHHQLP